MIVLSYNLEYNSLQLHNKRKKNSFWNFNKNPYQTYE